MTLKIYAVVLELVRRLAPYLPVLRARSSSLGDQLERALISIPLNLAEGAYSRGRNRHARYHSAAASAREALACLETAEALGWLLPLEPELGALFHRVIGTLVSVGRASALSQVGLAGRSPSGSPCGPSTHEHGALAKTPVSDSFLKNAAARSALRGPRHPSSCGVRQTQRFTVRGSAWSARISLGVLLACEALLGCGGLAEGGEQRPALGGSPGGVPEVSGGPEVPREDLGPLPPPEASSAGAPAPTGRRCMTQPYTRASVEVYDQAGLDELSFCSEVRGNLTIHPFEGADLRPLGALTSVEGTLMLGSALGQEPTPAFPSLAGLDSLQHVGGLVLRGVQADSLENLRSLQSVGGSGTDAGLLHLSSCSTLRDLGGLDRAVGFTRVYVENCARLRSLNGLLVASELDALTVADTPLNRLDALNDLQEVHGALMLSSTTLRTAGGLDALRKADQLNFQSNAQLTDLSALDALMEVNSFVVVNNPALRSLPDLRSLITLGDLNVFGNDLLQQIGQMPRLIAVTGVTIQSNPVLASIAALGTIRSAQRIQIDYNANLVDLDLRSLQSVSAVLHVAYNPQLDGTQITPPRAAGGAVIIGGNRGDQLSLDPCPWSGDGVCVGPPGETLCAAGADSDCSR